MERECGTDLEEGERGQHGEQGGGADLLRRGRGGDGGVEDHHDLEGHQPPLVLEDLAEVAVALATVGLLQGRRREMKALEAGGEEDR